MSKKTFKEAWQDLEKELSNFLLTGFYNMFIGVAIAMIILAVFGIDESFEHERLIVSIVAFISAGFGYYLKLGTRFLPIRKYFKLENEE